MTFLALTSSKLKSPQIEAIVSAIGVAREIAAFYNKKLTLPKLNFHATSVKKVSPKFDPFYHYRI